MDLRLVKASGALPPDCESVFYNSAIYERYFKEHGLEGSLGRSMESGELYLAVAEDAAAGTTVTAGAMEISMRGFCGLYPYLRLIGVRDSFRGAGVGAFMMDAFESMARESGAKRTTLMVSDFNAGARSFYEKRGYRLLGVLRDAAREGIDELLMTKEL